ncbi:MAG: hypothetical protein ACI4DT_00590 [Chordicoccus sp.]
MFLKDHFGCVQTVVLSIVMGFLMAIAAMFVDHLAFNISNIFKIWSMITTVVLLASLVIPYPRWAASLCRAMHLQPGSLAAKLIGPIIPTLILNTFNTVIVTAANVLYNPEIPQALQLQTMLQGIRHDWPIMLVLSYFAGFLAEAAGKAAAGAATVNLSDKKQDIELI